MSNSKGTIFLHIVLILLAYCLSFLILDRLLSVIYGFNFQPYGEYAPPGFAIWGHFGNGAAAALGAFVTFKVYDYGGKNQRKYLQVLSILFLLAIGAIIPFMNDYQHLVKNGVEDTIVPYVVFADLYVFSWGLLMYRFARSINRKVYVVLIALIAFLFLHIFLYYPMFPEFSWV